MEFKQMLVNARTAKELSQNDLAEMLEVVPAYISRLEKGYSLPSNELIPQICATLEVGIEEVFLQVMLEKTEQGAVRDIIKNIQKNLR